MQWVYYWYYSALGCHGHLVRDIQFSLFHHHYLWGHLLWKMNSASFAWLISNFFFIYLTEGHMPGIWSLWKKMWKKKKSLGEDEWERVHGGVWKSNRSLRPASLSRCICHSCPGDIFFSPKLLHTKQWESFSLQSSWSPPGFSLIVGGCILIFSFPGLWVMISTLTEDKKPPFLRLGGMHVSHHPSKLVVEQGFLPCLCVLSQHSYQNWTCLSLVSGCGHCEVRDVR